jgi:hypothetical protein
MRQIQRADGSVTTSSTAATADTIFIDRAGSVGRLDTFGSGLYRIFLKAGSWKVPAEVTSVRVRCYGAGGAGGSGPTGGGGGGGGGFAMGTLDVVPGTTYAIAIGNPSTFAGLVAASAGAGGSGATGGAGGSGTVGDYLATGGSGGAGICYSDYSTSGSNFECACGGGGGCATQIGTGGNGGSAVLLTSSSVSGAGGGGGILGDGATSDNVYGGGGGSPFGHGGLILSAGSYSSNYGAPDALGVSVANAANGNSNPAGSVIRFPFDVFTGGGGGGAYQNESGNGHGGIGGGGGGGSVQDAATGSQTYQAGNGGLGGGGGGGLRLGGSNASLLIYTAGKGGLGGGHGGQFATAASTGATGGGGGGCVIIEW